MRHIYFLLTLVVFLTLVGGLQAQIANDLIESVLFISNLYEDGYYDIALLEIEKIEHRLEYDKFSHQIWLIKADIYIKQSKWAGAKDILARLNKLSMESTLKAQVILSLANIENLLGNYAEALTLAEDFATRFPENEKISEAFQLRGDLYFRQKKYAEAQSIYEEMHTKWQSATTFVNLIVLNVNTGQIDDAERLLSELKVAYPRAFSEHQRGLLALLTELEIAGEYEKIVALCPDKITERTPYTEALTLKKIAAHIHLKNYLEAQLLLVGIKDDVRSVNYYRALLHKERGEEHLALPIFRLLADGSMPSADSRPPNTDNQTPTTHDQIRIMSFFNMVSIIAKTNTAEAYEMLQTFLVENPDQQWEGDILYQLGFIEFQNRAYQQSYEYILGALNFRLNNINYQNAIYLKGELEFLLKNYERSYQTFSDNLANIPAGFLDEAIFKLGLNAYFLGHREQAATYLTELVTSHPNSPKAGVAYYYLGEISLHTNQSVARNYYQQALARQMDVGVVYLRLAYVEFLRQDYFAALETLKRVPDTADYLYDKYLLQGNIFFAQREYGQAIESYKIAERNAADQVSIEYIWSRQAWTFYNLQQYDIATALYRRLAEQSSNPGQYILSAAGAAFNADNFEQAATLYDEYIRDFPDSPDINRAKTGLANSYFNLAQYWDAIEIWKSTVNDQQSQAVIEAALKGLQACYTRLNDLALFSEFINLVIFRSHNRDFRTLLFEFKANFEYEQNNYNASITTINQLIQTYPDKANDHNLKIMLANNYTWLQRYEEADQIYIELTRTSSDPNIYFEWGHIKWAQGDQIAAIRRYKRAVENSRNEQYWLTLLERQVVSKDSEFMTYYQQFMDFASEQHIPLATTHYIDWLIYQRNYNEALQQIETVTTADSPRLRANANFKRGEVQYLIGRYDEALTSFLRIRYVFNQFSDLRYQAELYIAKIYLRQGERDRALTLFESIKAYLSPEQIADFNAALR